MDQNAPSGPEKTQNLPSVAECELSSNTPLAGPTPLTIPKGSSIGSRTFAQIPHKFPTGYNGMLHTNPQNYPLPRGNRQCRLLASSLDPPTHHPKRHQNPISPFSTIHRTDRQTDRQKDIQMVQAIKRGCWKCETGKCGTRMIGTKLQGLKMRDWKIREQETYGTPRVA